jgi:hypothetical protein
MKTVFSFLSLHQKVFSCRESTLASRHSDHAFETKEVHILKTATYLPRPSEIG